MKAVLIILVFQCKLIKAGENGRIMKIVNTESEIWKSFDKEIQNTVYKKNIGLRDKIPVEINNTSCIVIPPNNFLVVGTGNSPRFTYVSNIRNITSHVLNHLPLYRPI